MVGVVTGQSVSGECLPWVHHGTDCEDLHRDIESAGRLQELATAGCYLQTDGLSQLSHIHTLLYALFYSWKLV